MKLTPIKCFFLILVMHNSVVLADTFDKQIQAQEAYGSGEYERSIAIYEELTQNGETDALFYNLGNAYFKNNQMGKAILNYERALRLNAKNENAAYNLQLANSKIQDKIEPVEIFFLTQWHRDLRTSCSSNTWIKISFILFSLMLLGTLGYAFSPYKWLRKSSFFIALLFFVISITTFIFARQQKNYIEQRTEAIVLEGSVTVKSSPDESGTELFVIHEGTKVFIKSSLNHWVEISLTDGNVGWIKKTTIEQI